MLPSVQSDFIIVITLCSVLSLHICYFQHMVVHGTRRYTRSRLWNSSGFSTPVDIMQHDRWRRSFHQAVYVKYIVKLMGSWQKFARRGWHPPPGHLLDDELTKVWSWRNTDNNIRIRQRCIVIKKTLDPWGSKDYSTSAYLSMDLRNILVLMMDDTLLTLITTEGSSNLLFPFEFHLAVYFCFSSFFTTSRNPITTPRGPCEIFFVSLTSTALQ